MVKFWKRLLSLVQERWWGVLWLRLKWTLNFTQWNKQNSSQGTQSRLEFQDWVSYPFFLPFVNHRTSSHTSSASVTFWNMPMYKMTPTLDICHFSNSIFSIPKATLMQFVSILDQVNWDTALCVLSFAAVTEKYAIFRKHEKDLKTILKPSLWSSQHNHLKRVT